MPAVLDPIVSPLNDEFSQVGGDDRIIYHDDQIGSAETVSDDWSVLNKQFHSKPTSFRLKGIQKYF